MKNLPAMMGQMKEMQAKMEALRVEGVSGGGMVKAVINGRGDLLDLAIEKEIIDPEDPEMLQDLIISAIADAKQKVAEQMQGEISDLAGGVDLSSLGINLPGM
ncbi:MAG: YbaB/EbfC family nucleoid-associated protein [Planctomycetes bacterium]|nr:YbaB/EbfC family nucleoid-associated protein [Planctomycetota bacterium]